MAHHAIELNGVAKRYEEPDRPPILAVQDFSLSVRRGEIFCLVGPSGCGKTTVLNLAAGFIQPSSGTVIVDGQAVRSPHSRCGVVFQQDAVFPWMTVAENVGYGLRWSNSSTEKRRATVAHYLSVVGLTSFADRWPRELSGGMRKRVDLARAYATNPTILLLDEPFGSLDVLTRAEMQHLLLDTWLTEQKSVLFVTHDVEEAAFLGQRVGIVSPRPGRIHHVFDIPFSIEERQADLRLSKSFMEIRRMLHECLMAPQLASQGDAERRRVVGNR